MINLESIRCIVEEEFADIVVGTQIIDAKLRVLLSDGSFIDFWWSREIRFRYAHHWERGHVDGTIYRHDNMPHKKWEAIRTFPKHFHSGSKGEVVQSQISEGERGVREFMNFIREKL
ncbi:DUF6516 family protein [Dehalococcoidia bacterium]|nr:DUF6516 family protein [Dehalococcoidia bacterium]